ncbi:hypothetical protein F1559_003444 [Cyanidiococcus yangmingshanensis]|uniref:Uncharacterized protein n=1 Tax=Cyanidiococcus yangmingshanensis TaxID=2690220 RepID=A0A7J7IJ53_9RHOD|nr:hypothetical protein F1559_003444 [Cyanidiococcus yangmingshanensis]
MPQDEVKKRSTKRQREVATMQTVAVSDSAVSRDASEDLAKGLEPEASNSAAWSSPTCVKVADKESAWSGEQAQEPGSHGQRLFKKSRPTLFEPEPRYEDSLSDAPEKSLADGYFRDHLNENMHRDASDSPARAADSDAEIVEQRTRHDIEDEPEKSSCSVDRVADELNQQDYMKIDCLDDDATCPRLHDDLRRVCFSATHLRVSATFKKIQDPRASTVETAAKLARSKTSAKTGTVCEPRNAGVEASMIARGAPRNA